MSDQAVLADLIGQPVIAQFPEHPFLKSDRPVLDYSRFLTRNLRLDSALGEWILGHDLSRGWSSGRIRDEVTHVSCDIDSEASLHRSLRDLRRRYMSLIAWADLCGVYAMPDSIAAVSELADSLIQMALEHLYPPHVERFGQPIGAHSGEVAKMVVLGLGKLGGGELNFSSDVDLIFCFSEPGESTGPKVLSNDEFFIRLGRRLIKVLDEPSADGFVFRIDMRLRPNGASGPLALSFDAMEHYYQTHGRDWERYAFIKARVVAGDPVSGSQLLDSLRPFVYRKYLDFSAFDSIREMKQLIDRELERKGRQDNIKLGRGGIREVEFIVQCHQLIRGGREPDLQTPKLKTALAGLRELEIISAEEQQRLYAAYVFLRDTEHRLQMYDDLQTQTLPGDEKQFELLAHSMGSATVDDFRAELGSHMDYVHDEFSRLFAVEGDGEEQGSNDFQDIWLEVVDADAAPGLLEAHGFTDPGHCFKLINGIRHGRVYQSFSRNGRDRLDRLVPASLERISATRNPDECLIRFITIIEGIGRRSAYFALLGENPLALRQLIDLIGASAWIANWISQHPVILDELLDPISNAVLTDVSQMRERIEKRLKRAGGDMELEMDLLREYKNSYLLRIAAMEIAEFIEPLEVRRGLSDLAEAILRVSAGVAESSLSPKIREQVAGIRSSLCFGIVAYGKMGSRELSYGSDLDLVFLFDADGNGANEASGNYFFGRLVQRILHYLSTATRAGVLYETDIRLRPSGRSGTMVSSLKAFADYQSRQAWTWEHQALVRARMISDSSALIESFEAIRSVILCQPRAAQEVRAEVRDMRKRMSEANCKSSETEFDLKLGDGGLVDIEFLVQYLVLAHAASVPDVVQPRTTADQLMCLAEQGILEPAEAEGLVAVYHAYLARELSLKLQEREALIPASDMREQRELVHEVWQKRVNCD